jgi:hypothetical protein
MKKLVMFAMMSVVSACAVQAQEGKSPLSFDVSADVYSADVWRGIVKDKHVVGQLGATADVDMRDAGKLSLDVWSDWDLSQKSGHSPTTRTGGGIKELDFTLRYAVDVGPVGLRAGHIWYTFPGGGWPNRSYSTEEIFVSAAFNNDIITPYVIAYYDYNRVKGTYANAGLNKEIAANDRITVGGDAWLGGGSSHYVNKYFGDHSASFTDLNVKGYVSYKLTDNFSVGATVAYTVVVDNDLHTKGDYMGDCGIFWGGINLGAKF